MVRSSVNQLNKIIFRTAIEGLVWTIVVFSFGLGVFSMAFPGAKANFYDTVGNHRLSAMYHSRVHARSATPENLFTAFDRNLVAGNSGAIIRYCTAFFVNLEPAERDRIITRVDAHLVQRAGECEITIAIATNTDDRLRRGFIRALLNSDAPENTQIARQMFYDATQIVCHRRPSFAILEFPPTPEFADLRTQFVQYFYAYIAHFGAVESTPANAIRAQFFINHALEFLANV